MKTVAQSSIEELIGELQGLATASRRVGNHAIGDSIGEKASLLLTEIRQVFSQPTAPASVPEGTAKITRETHPEIISEHREATATPPTEQATEGGINAPTTEAWMKRITTTAPAVAQGETPADMPIDELLELYQQISHRVALYNNEPQIQRMFELRAELSQRFATMQRELNASKAELERREHGSTGWEWRAEIMKLLVALGIKECGWHESFTFGWGGPFEFIAGTFRERDTLRQSVARLTEERDQARQDLEERCAENDRERAAHLQAYQEACKERDAARAKLGGAVMFGAVGGRLMTRIFEAADMSLENATDVELQLVRLLSELAELRLDRERLDWMQAERASVEVNVKEPLRYTIQSSNDFEATHTTALYNIREAIDAARNQQEKAQ